VVYDLETEPKTLDVSWESIVSMPQGNEPETVDYRYSEAQDGSGDFQFTAFGDTNDPGPLAETIEMRSRWNATGAGRGDARIHDGDLDLTVTASECWGTAFTVVYATDSAGWEPTIGDPAACAFATAAYPE
jgi:hypothetical protein